jgi:molybdopterin-synthase adenylyltransferase
MDMMSTSPVRLKISAMRMLSGNALLLAVGKSRARLEPFDDLAEEVLWRLARGVDIAEELGRLPDERRASFARWFDVLTVGSFLEPLRPSHSMLCESDIQRFDRLLNRLATYEPDGRSSWKILEDIRGKKVGVLGVGGLASWLIYNLACCGVSRFRLIDADVVDLSNLNRSILFAEADVGRKKTEAVRDSLLRFAPRTAVECVDLQVSSAEALGEVIGGLDLLIATGDKPAWLIREWVSLAGRRVGVPTLHPGRGRVGPFDLNDGQGCALCEWADLVTRQPTAPEQIARLRRLPPPDPGPFSPIGAMTAAFAAQEAFRFLADQEPLTRNAVWQLERDFTSRMIAPARHVRCPTCGDDDRVSMPSAIIPGVVPGKSAMLAKSEVGAAP